MQSLLGGIRGENAMPVVKPKTDLEWYLLMSTLKDAVPTIWFKS